MVEGTGIVYTKSNRPPGELMKRLRQEYKDNHPNQLFFGPAVYCPGCGAEPKHQVVRNYDFMWGDGDIYCTECGSYVRMFDRD